MEQNSIVDMIDDEITRLREVQQILQTLLPVETVVAPLSVTSSPVPSLAAKPEPAPEIVASASEPAEVASEESTVKRHVSRRGISTGRRGPRRNAPAPAPRALDSSVPRAPVVSRPPVVVVKPQVSAQTQPAEGTLEAWVRSLRPTSQPA